MNYNKNFAIYLKIEKDLAENTISGYVKDVEHFIDSIDCNVLDVTTPTIRSYIGSLSSSGRKRNSITRALCSLKSFYNYLRDVEKVISTSPTEEVKLSSREKSLPKALSKTDTLKLLDAATKDGIKSHVLVELLYGLGGRVSEIISLEVENMTLLRTI